MRKDLTFDCGFHITRFSFLFTHFAILDTPNYLADSLFIKHRVRVFFGREFHKDGVPYIVIFCKCFKKDAAKFLAAVNELPNKMLICGHSDYTEYCKAFKEMFDNFRQQTN